MRDSKGRLKRLAWQIGVEPGDVLTKTGGGEFAGLSLVACGQADPFWRVSQVVEAVNHRLAGHAGADAASVARSLRYPDPTSLDAALANYLHKCNKEPLAGLPAALRAAYDQGKDRIPGAFKERAGLRRSCPLTFPFELLSVPDWVPAAWVGRRFEDGAALHAAMNELPARLGRPPVTFGAIMSMHVEERRAWEPRGAFAARLAARQLKAAACVRVDASKAASGGTVGVSVVLDWADRSGGGGGDGGGGGGGEAVDDAWSFAFLSSARRTKGKLFPESTGDGIVLAVKNVEALLPAAATGDDGNGDGGGNGSSSGAAAGDHDIAWDHEHASDAAIHDFARKAGSPYLVSLLQKAVRRRHAPLAAAAVRALPSAPPLRRPDLRFTACSGTRQMLWRLFIAMLEDARLVVQPPDGPGSPPGLHVEELLALTLCAHFDPSVVLPTRLHLRAVATAAQCCSVPRRWAARLALAELNLGGFGETQTYKSRPDYGAIAKLQAKGALAFAVAAERGANGGGGGGAIGCSPAVVTELLRATAFCMPSMDFDHSLVLAALGEAAGAVRAPPPPVSSSAAGGLFAPPITTTAVAQTTADAQAVRAAAFDQHVNRNTIIWTQAELPDAAVAGTDTREVADYMWRKVGSINARGEPGPPSKAARRKAARTRPAPAPPTLLPTIHAVQRVREAAAHRGKALAVPFPFPAAAAAGGDGGGDGDDADAGGAAGAKATGAWAEVPPLLPADRREGWVALFGPRRAPLRRRRRRERRPRAQEDVPGAVQALLHEPAAQAHDARPHHRIDTARSASRASTRIIFTAVCWSPPCRGAGCPMLPRACFAHLLCTNSTRAARQTRAPELTHAACPVPYLTNAVHHSPLAMRVIILPPLP